MEKNEKNKRGQRIVAVVGRIAVVVSFIAAAVTLIVFAFGKNLPDLFPRRPTPVAASAPMSVCPLEQQPVVQYLTVTEQVVAGLRSLSPLAEASFKDEVGAAFAAYAQRVAALVNIYAGTGGPGDSRSISSAQSVARGAADALKNDGPMFLQLTVFNSFADVAVSTNTIELQVYFYKQGCTIAT